MYIIKSVFGKVSKMTIEKDSESDFGYYILLNYFDLMDVV